MTVPTQNGDRSGRRESSSEAAIAAGIAAGDDEAVMRAVAGSEVVVPQPAGAQDELDEGSLSLPVIEAEGTSYVPVFTSEDAMKQAAPEVEEAVTVEVAELAANWPEQDLWLAVNPGTDEQLTLPPDAVRALPAYAEDPVE